MDIKVRIPDLFATLVKNPVKAASEGYLLNYDTDMLGKIFYLGIAQLYNIQYVFSHLKDIPGASGAATIFAFGMVLFPMMFFIFRYLNALCYFVLFRFAGRIDIKFAKVNTIVLPLMSLTITVRLVLGLIFMSLPFVFDIVSVFISVWEYWLMYLILSHTLMQPKGKSIVLALVLPVIYFLFTITSSFI